MATLLTLFRNALSHFGAQLLLIGISLLPVALHAQGLTSGTVTLYPNNTTIDAGLNASVTSTSTELVTMGVPFADCTLINTDHFRLFDETATEVPVFVKTVMEWPATRLPCTETSVRALKVQFVFDATGAAPVEYTWDINAAGRTTTDIATEAAVSEVVHDNAGKLGFKEPRVFAIHTPAYLIQSGLIPPTSAVGSDVHDTNYYPEKWEEDSRDIAYSDTDSYNSGTDVWTFDPLLQDWLFDRVSTNYRQAIRNAAVTHYREAYVSHEFYINKIEVTGTNTSQADYCLGGFDLGGAAHTFGDGGKGCDAKYIYSQNLVLHLALTGDDSWEPSENGTPSTKVDTREKVWKAMADLLFQGSLRTSTSENTPVVPQEGFSTPYTSIDASYTERKSGLGLQTLMGVCALLPTDPDVCGWVDTVIDNMYLHQTANPDGRGNLGYLAHSWRGHEGGGLFWLGTTAAAYTAASTIVIDKTFTGGPDVLVSGNMVRIGGVDIALTANPVDNLDGTWTLQLASPITRGANDPIYTTWTDTGMSALVYNQSSDRAFSPWMQSMVADGVWFYYNETEDTVRRGNAKDLLLGMAQAYAAYAIDGTRTPASTEALINAAFFPAPSTNSVFDGAVSATTCNIGVNEITRGPYTRYVANDLMVTPQVTKEYTDSLFATGGNSDQHIPEGLFQLSVGLFFETDRAKRAAMEQIASDMLQWYEVYPCSSGNKTRYGGTSISDPPRAFSWQSKPDPFGTYKWVKTFAINYDVETFTEAAANDGSVSEVITLTIGGGVEFADKVFESPADFEVTNLPSGMSATLTRTSATTAQLALTGAATSNDPANNVSDLTVEIKDGALDSFEATRLSNSLKSDLAITFINPLITYSGNSFSEAPANDGSISTSITLDLSGDTFVTAAGAFPAGHYTVTGLPATLAASLTATSNVQAVLTLTGNADPHGDLVDTSTVNFSFEDGAFTTTATASTVTDSSKTLSIDFIEPTLAYGGTTFNEDASTNVGAISNSLTVTLSDDTFVIPAGVMTKDTHYTVANVPTGLAVVVTGTSATTATIALAGNAALHGNGNSIADLTINFLPAALTTTTDMANVAEASRTDLDIDFVEPGLTFGAGPFTESAATNNGTIGNTVSITLADDTFAVPAGAMTLGIHYTVSNVPAGLTPVVTGTSGTSATFGFSGSATDHGNSDEVSNVGISFLANAFTTSISTANLLNASKTDFAINFVEPGLAYSGMVFNEDAGSNDGSIANALTVTLSEDTFVVSGGAMTLDTHYAVSNLPDGLTVLVTGTSATTATIALTGAATDHLVADGITNFTLNFLDDAFTTSPAAGLLEAMKMDITIQFVETGLAYDFNTFVESNNDGSTGTVLNLSLVGGETFTVPAAAMTLSTHYTVANVPAGLTAVVTGTSTTTATLALTGNATDSSSSDDVSDLTLTFLDAAFTGLDASAVPNSTKSDLAVDFLDGVLSYSGGTFTEAAANDGSITTVLDLTLVADTFAVPAGAMTNPTHYTIANIPGGLTAVVTGTSSTTATVALTGTAGSHANVNDVSNLTLSFTGDAFGGGSAAEVVGASKADLIVDFIDASLTYSTSTFSEAGADDGSISTVANLTLVADSFVISGGAMTEFTHYTVANVPAGLTVVVTGTSPTAATVALTGNADSHLNAHDVANLTVTFLNAAFVSGDASGIAGAIRSDLIVNFTEPAPVDSGGGGGGGGSTTTTGEVQGLTVAPGSSVSNQGVLTDLNNAGTVTGGRVKGSVTNQPTGVLSGVTLDPGTVVSGGKLTGSLKGAGSVKNALLDITDIEPGVTIGSGTKVTRSTVNSVAGLNLTGAIRDESGALNLNHPLFVDTDESEQTALDLAKTAVNNLFGNDDSTVDDTDGDGTATIDNPVLADSIVLVTPTSIETTSEANGALLNTRGELTIINDGIKMTFAPSSADGAAFTAGLEAAGASSESLAAGLVQVSFDGGMIAFHFSFVAAEASGSGAILALSNGQATFSELGSIADPANYRVLVTYPSGVSQTLIPALHDIDSFELWMEAGDFSYAIDSLTGIIEISDANVVVFRGIPEYLLRDSVGTAGVINFNNAVDMNSDGISDVYFDTDAFRQVIYGLPLQ